MTCMDYNLLASIRKPLTDKIDSLTQQLKAQREYGDAADADCIKLVSNNNSLYKDLGECKEALEEAHGSIAVLTQQLAEAKKENADLREMHLYNLLSELAEARDTIKTTYNEMVETEAKLQIAVEALEGIAGNLPSNRLPWCAEARETLGKIRGEG